MSATRHFLPLIVALLLPGSPPGSAGPSALTGGVVDHVVVRGETLRSIGSRYGVDPETLAAGNSLRSGGILPTGRVLRIDNRHIVPAGYEDGEILINVPQRMLFFRGAGATMLSMPVAVGRPDWRTPVTGFSIVVKETNPSWEPPASIRAEARREGRILPQTIPPGPSNPLGKYWLGLSLTGIGIHGTNAPSSIYRAVTHGCVRLHPDDIERLFEMVSIGTAGRTVYEPVLVASEGADVFIEAHRDVYRRGTSPGPAQLRALTDAAGLTGRIDWDDAERILKRREGIARVVKPASEQTSGRVPAPVAYASADVRAETRSTGCGH